MRAPILLASPLLLISLIFAAPAFAEVFDVVLDGGRVMDPETGVDAVRNVGITQGRIMRISPETLAGKRVLDAKGLVVAPGFIDLHQHGQDAASSRLKAFDGVTTALEMEIGVPSVAESTLAARRKGRLQEGADADVVVFDPKTVADRATYAAPREPSTGMKYVIVGGTVLIDEGKLVPNTFPGKPLTAGQTGK